MGVRIKLATTTEELDELFQVRHRVFISEKRYFSPSADGRLLDRFDAFPTTANIVATAEGRVVGGVRIVEPSSAGAPVDDWFDFRPYLPEGSIAGSGSMLVMEEAYRHVPRVTFAMLGMMYYWALCKGLTHITGVAASGAEKLFLGSGYRPVAPRIFHEASGNWAMPVMLDIVELNDRFSAFVDKHQFRHFLQSFERQFHQKGELIIRRGEPGTAAYVIVEGRVGVSVGGARRPPGPTPPAEHHNGGASSPRPRPHVPISVPSPGDDGPVSVRNPGRMTDRGQMSDSPTSTRSDIPSSMRPPAMYSPPPPRDPGRGSDSPASTRSGPHSGGPVSVREMGPGEVFGELSLITAQPRSADVIALTDVDLMVLERDVFHKQVAENPQVALNLLSMIGHRLMSVTDRLSEQAAGPDSSDGIEEP
jgi:CRP-like cAMP-binding protein/N-acyl-L-homoserine lactone synthetase